MTTTTRTSVRARVLRRLRLARTSGSRKSAWCWSKRKDPPSADDQEHRIGPVALFEAEIGDWGEIGIELGFLFGLTDATPDNTFKFNLEYEWGPGGDDGAERIDDD